MTRARGFIFARRGVYVILFVGYIGLVVLLFHRLYDRKPAQIVGENKTVIVYPTKQVQRTVQVGVPLQLRIPKINIATTIDSVGITADGAMDIKKDPSIVAWYNLGARPGDVGSAVIAGHYGWDNGTGSIFNDLHTLKPGDVVTVTDDKQVVLSFIVREIKEYDPVADAKEVFRSGDGKSHLNLVTCEGTWKSSEQTYSKRLVVFTDKKA